MCACVGLGGAGNGQSDEYKKASPLKHQESQVFVPVHPLARAFGENSVKLLSQVYWSPGLLEREVIYPPAIGQILRAVSSATLSVRMQHRIATITPNMTILLQSDADGAGSVFWSDFPE